VQIGAREGQAILANVCVAVTASFSAIRVRGRRWIRMAAAARGYAADSSPGRSGVRAARGIAGRSGCAMAGRGLTGSVDILRRHASRDRRAREGQLRGLR